MRIFILILFISVFLVPAGLGQDTVRIKNVKASRPDRINILVSPKGVKTIIEIRDNAEGWTSGEMTETGFETIIDTSSGISIAANVAADAFGASYVDPALTAGQKAAIKLNECKNTRFAGLSRSKVKTSVVRADANTYQGLYNFVRTLPKDADMKDVVRELDKPYAQRAIQEGKNVSVRNVYLLAYKREPDNDYHLILCNKEKTIFFNAEISGLPGNNAASYQVLKAVRNTFDQYPGARGCGDYVFCPTPILISKLNGSLFFDTDHSAGSVGPRGFKPKTAWEIHPVTLIQF